MSETQAPRVWIAGNPEPPDVRLRVRDKHGDIWTPEQVLGGVRAWSTPETALATWDYLTKKWGPVTEVLADDLGVSGEDRSEPTPAPRQWAVEHPDVRLSVHRSEWSVLYTLSKLPGGRIVVRDAPDQPWRPETACLCVTVPDTGHYAGCPDTSEVVSPEGTP